MRSTRFYSCCLAALCLAIVSTSAEKQIKLEDIEKDTLKAAQQAKYEKQVQQQQQQQQQQPQYQQTTYQYQPQVYADQNAVYQTQPSYSQYSQYFLPQQYIPQTVLSGYTPLTSNSLGTGYASPSAFQTYLSPQLALPSVSSFHASQPIAAATQNQPIIMTFAAPSLAAFQHQPYYQGSLQYYPAQTAQPTQFYYTPQTTDQTSSSQASSSVIYPATQQYVSYQPLTSSKGSSSFSQQYISTAPQTFPVSTFSGQQEYTSFYSPQTSSNSIYSNTEPPTTFVTVKAPQHLVASQNQQQLYSQTQTTTMSPLQAKYLNSPQYLAQNYNTIQSSHLYSKGVLSSGVKSTVSPPLKAPNGGSFVSSSSYASPSSSNFVSPSSSNFASSSSSNYASPSSSASSYLPFRSLPPKNF